MEQILQEKVNSLYELQKQQEKLEEQIKEIKNFIKEEMLKKEAKDFNLPVNEKESLYFTRVESSSSLTFDKDAFIKLNPTFDIKNKISFDKENRKFYKEIKRAESLKVILKETK